jgi:ketosteroid isomerase-like protein
MTAFNCVEAVRTFALGERDFGQEVKSMKRIAILLVIISMAFSVMVRTPSVTAQSGPPAGPELTKLLNDFLEGASRNDPAMHDRFWADDLIYTSALGERRGKPEIMARVRTARTPQPAATKSNYSAEEIRIQQYGDAAIVAFRLVNRSEKDGKTEVEKYFNTGTFIKRSGKWQVVAWQATKTSN